MLSTKTFTVTVDLTYLLHDSVLREKATGVPHNSTGKLALLKCKLFLVSVHQSSPLVQSTVLVQSSDCRCPVASTFCLPDPQHCWDVPGFSNCICILEVVQYWRQAWLYADICGVKRGLKPTFRVKPYVCIYSETPTDQSEKMLNSMGAKCHIGHPFMYVLSSNAAYCLVDCCQ